jgi:hypothetical protein
VKQPSFKQRQRSYTARRRKREKTGGGDLHRPHRVKRNGRRRRKKAAKDNAGEQEAPERVRIGGKAVAKKPLKALYEGTGLDPNWKHRKKLMRKVKKKLKKSKETSSSTGSTSSTGSSGMDNEELLEDRSKIHKVASLGPGLLSAQGISAMKEHLTQIAGTGWESDPHLLAPLLCLYHRTYMLNKLTGGVNREFATLCWIGDQLLQGRVAEGMDGLMQRLKSLEMTAGGTSWATSQKLELVPPPTAAIGTRSEYQVARREARLDQQLLPPAHGGEKGQGKTREKGKEKGQKGKGKAKEGDGKKSA